MVRPCAWVCLLLLLAVSSPSAQTTPQRPALPSALVMGTVIDDVTKEPLADAAVIARVAGSVVDQVRSNRAGVFVFPSVPAGDVSLGAVLPGYLGSGSAGRPVVVRAAAGQRVVDAVVRLKKFLAIGGTVRDEAGEPVVDVAVGLQLRGERGQWTSLLTARTDDRGMYRFAQLTAGDYRVLVSPTAAAVPHAGGGNRRMMYPATFAPAVRTPQEASVVVLKPGSDRSAVDVTLAPLGEMRVAGRLSAGAGVALSRIPIRLIAADGGGLTTPLTVATATTDVDGRFEFPRVPSGRYRVYMYVPPRPAPPAAAAVELSTSSERLTVRNGAANAAAIPAGRTVWADTPLTVEDKDIVDLDVPVATGFKISGRAVFDGTTARPADVLFAMQRVDVALWPMGEARVAPDGSFETTELAPGRYIVVARSGLSPWQLRSADYRGVNFADTPVEVREPLTNIVLTYTDKQPAVSGTVRDDRGAGVDTASVVIFPADRRLWNVAPTSWRMKLARTSQTGEFVLRSVPSGEYFCAALTDEAAVNWNDLDRLAEISARATRVVLAEGQPAVMDLRMPGAAKSAQTDELGEAHGPFVDESADAAGLSSPALARASINGVVREQANGHAALRGVTVELKGNSDGGNAVTYTDGAGRFAFTDIAPGSYRLYFSKPAYLAAEYGAKRSGGSGTAVIVGNADVAVEAELARGAVIGGRVTDSRGRPLNWTKIALIGAREAGGAARLFSIDSAMPKEILTDDRGEYRIYGLAPGTYFVAATPGGGGGAFSGRPTTDADIVRAKDGTAAIEPRRAPAEAFAPTFFPSAREFASAQPVTVAMGQERLGVDVVMGFSSVATLRGTVRTSAGRPAAGAQLAVFPVGPYVPNADVVLTSTPNGEATSGGGSVRVGVSQGGTFAISGLTPGPYNVFARGTTAASEFALMTVTIGSSDAALLDVALRPTPIVNVSLIAADASAGMNFSNARVALTPVDGASLSVAIPPTPVDAAGTVALKGALPGRYWINVTGLPKGAAITNGVGTGERLMRDPIVVADTAEPTSVALTLGPAASLSGAFTDLTGAAATDYFVIAFDVDRAAWITGSPRLQAVRPHSDGRFVFSDLPPGRYRLAAVTDVDQNGWSDPALLEQLLAASVEVTVTPGKETVQNLRIAK